MGLNFGDIDEGAEFKGGVYPRTLMTASERDGDLEVFRSVAQLVDIGIPAGPHRRHEMCWCSGTNLEISAMFVGTENAAIFEVSFPKVFAPP